MLIPWSHVAEAQVRVVEAADRPLVLGHLEFPTSTKVADAQEAFVNGLLLLHLFEYRLATGEFRRAQKLDPDFALAYWGEAMAMNHPIWDQQDHAQARGILKRFGPDRASRLTRIPDKREHGFFAAVEALYGSGTKAERDLAHAREMEKLALQFPDDDEVQLFYALALFGVQAGVRDVRTYMHATALAQRVFNKNPLHPGAAHYLIHGVDDATHAALGVDAARALAKIAPDSPHALHMTSHVFLMLGLWDDVVVANEASSNSANRWCGIQGIPLRHYGHTNFWLEYAYLQQGRHATARELLLTARAESLDPSIQAPPENEYDPDNSVQGSVVQMWSRYLLETGDWQDEIADWDFPIGNALDPNLTRAWTQGFRCTQLGNPAGAAEWLGKFVSFRESLEKAVCDDPEPTPWDRLYLVRVGIMELILRSAICEASADMDEALALARKAVSLEEAMPDAFGPPFVDLPSREWLGRLLLRAGDPDAAQTAYQSQLDKTPLRSPSLLGLANAADRAGHREVAMRAMGQLRANWQNADPAVTDVLAPLPGRMSR